MPQRKKNPRKEATKARPGIGATPGFPENAIAGAALIVIAVFLVYLPAMNGGFVLDDDLLLTENNLVQAGDGVYRFWCTTEATDYWPVTNASLWLEWRLWGLNPAGYHAGNLALHIVESLSVWVVLRRLSIPGACWAALIFAIHPVNVESVAWIASRKNLTAMLFFLFSILWCLKASMPAASVGMAPSTIRCPPPTAHSPLWYPLSLAAFVLAVLGKGSAAVLPVLLLLIVWHMRQVTKRDFLRFVPFFLVAAAFSAVNVWFQTHGSAEAIRSSGFVERLLAAGGALWFYLYKAVLPIDLAFVYPLWRVAAGNLLWWLPLAAALLLTAVLWLYRNSWSRPLLFAWGFFCVTLVPIAGFVDVGFMKHSLVADRYEHAAIIAPIALAAAGWSLWQRRARRSFFFAAASVAVGAAGSLAFFAWQQSGLYRDAFTLYQAALIKNPGSWMAHYNLANALRGAGQTEASIEHYRQAARLKPDYYEAQNNLGVLLVKTGKPDQAIEHCEKALRLMPKSPEAHYNLANALKAVGRRKEAIDLYLKALALKSDYAEAHNNLGLLLAEADRANEAIEHYHEALAAMPDYPEAENNLALALAQSGRLDEAVGRYERAIKLAPDFPEAHNNLGLALSASNRTDEAIEQYVKALKARPEYIEAHFNLGTAFFRKGRLQEAAEQYEQAIRLKDDFAAAYYNLALVHARMHESSQSIAAAKKALELARSQGQAAMAAQIEDWLKSQGANPTK
jgi:tetratricopeptide (TPR) repeat protein